jgi:hypothetical protein
LEGFRLDVRANKSLQALFAWSLGATGPGTFGADFQDIQPW